MIKNINKIILIIIFNLSSAYATEFDLPKKNNQIIGEVQTTRANFSDNTTTISSKYNLGLNSIVAANPDTTDNKLSTRDLVIPTAFILPPLPQEGVIINLPEMRMYYYPKNGGKVLTYPIGIGKAGNTIPIKNSKITWKKVNPSWTPGPDVRRYNEAQGVHLPKTLPPGPDNPLGPYAIYLNIPTFLIHSTVFPESIGRRASFGCIRMNETDIKDFFPIITAGTSVKIINLPNKIGWRNNRLYLEAHPLLEEHNTKLKTRLKYITAEIEKKLENNKTTIIDWPLVAHLLSEPDGVPHEIGVKISKT
ncbi:L,D-transpeptidase family protein [Gammaproteobacteria bacterium]|nr:L,D-transpeptidase family protein [Gammaproteobacteria bacterium]